MGDLTNEDINFIRLKLDAVREGIYLTKRGVRGLLDMAERCANAEAERDCLNSQCDYYKADLDAIRAMLPATEGVGTQDLVRGYVRVAGELLRVAKDIVADEDYAYPHTLAAAIEAAERAGVKP